MAYIELVIEIPEKVYEYIKRRQPYVDKYGYTHIGLVFEAILNGTPLPKGHRLMDADEFINSLKGIERLHIDDELRSSILDAVNTNILVEADKESEEQV